MEESHKRMRTSPGAAMVVKKEQGGSCQRPAAAASPVAGRGRAGSAPTPTSGAQGSDGTSKVTVVLIDKDLWLHCSACSGTLKPPIYKCEVAGHKVCSACRGGTGGGSNPCRACAVTGNGAAAASTYRRCSGDDLDALMGALQVDCPYKAYGCREQVPYLDADDHRLSCLNLPCSCSVSPCSGGFLGTPRALLDHLTGPAHSWPTTNIHYGKVQQLDLTLPRPDGLRLLVSKEDGRVFLLVAGGYDIAAAGETTAATTMAQVSLTCLRATATAGPHYRARLWALAPRHPATGVKDRHDAEFLVESRRSPCEIGAEEDGTVLQLKRKFLHGEERKIMLYVRIVKL